MSFQAYLDTIKSRTGLGPDEFRALAAEKDLMDAKAGAIIAWLKQDYGLGHGHAMAVVWVIKHEPGTPFPGQAKS